MNLRIMNVRLNYATRKLGPGSEEAGHDTTSCYVDILVYSRITTIYDEFNMADISQLTFALAFAARSIAQTP